MERLDLLTEEFITKFDKFLEECDPYEEDGSWDLEEFGEMDGYYENELASVIIRLIVADGEIGEKEVEYMNKNFGFEFTADDLQDIYDCCRDEIGEDFEARIRNGLSDLAAISENLAAAYKELLEIICAIIIESDGVAADEELEELSMIRRLIAE